MSHLPLPPKEVMTLLQQGVVIPAHPLALTSDRRLDKTYQQALTRYYCAAGAGGIAVGVHTTQFEIREPCWNLLGPVLELASATVDAFQSKSGRTVIKVAGICGSTQQAVAEAELARSKGYHIGLLSLAAMKTATDDQLLAHCRAVSQIMPLFGFYLQPSIGGRVLSFAFWRRFAEIENVVAIKIAPFSRYHTLDVIRAVAEAGRAGAIALYTGNDDNIVLDLLTSHRFVVDKKPVTQRIVGGLLGHWAVWTEAAVRLLDACHRIAESGKPVPQEMLVRAIEVTDCNATLFDSAHDYAGCIAGIHEALRRQGLMRGRWCLDPEGDLSPGQSEEIDRVRAAYPHLNDDAFVAEHLSEWLSKT